MRRIPMILTSDIAPPGQQILDGLIDSSVAIGKFISIAARSQIKQLMA